MIDDNNLAQSLLVNKEDFRKTMETNARFQELMMMYRCAIREIQTKLEILNDEFKTKNQRNPIDSIRRVLLIKCKEKVLRYPSSLSSTI